MLRQEVLVALGRSRFSRSRLPPPTPHPQPYPIYTTHAMLCKENDRVDATAKFCCNLRLMGENSYAHCMFTDTHQAKMCL